MGYSFRLAARVLLYAPSHRQDSTYQSVTPVMVHWLEREIAQWVHQEGLIRRPIAPWANAVTTELHPRCSLQWVRVRACCGVAPTHLGPGHVVVPTVEGAAQLHGQSLLVVLWLVFRHSKQHRRSVGGCQHKQHSTHSVGKTICDDAQENQSDVANSETSVKAH